MIAIIWASIILAFAITAAKIIAALLIGVVAFVAARRVYSIVRNGA